MSKDDKEKKSSDLFLDFMKERQESNNKKQENQEKKEKKEKDKNNKEGISFYDVLKKLRILSFVSFLMDLLDKLFNELFRDKRKMMLFSLFLAVIFYASVSGEDTTTIRKVSNVTVQVVNLDDSYLVSGVPDTVDMYLEGTSLQINTATVGSNYYAYVDLSGYTEGIYDDVPLNVSGLNSDVSTIILPDTLTITISQKIEKTFTLGYRFLNEDTDADYVIEKPVLSLSEITVTGSQTDIDRISSVEVVIDVDGVTSNTTKTGTIKAYDIYDNEITTVYFEQDTLSVDLVVAESSKEITLVPTIVGSYDSSLAVSQVQFSSSKIVYYGDEETLAQYSELEVEVNVSNIDENGVVANVELSIPNDVNCSDTTVDATVTFETKDTQTYNVTINVINGDDLNYTLSTTKAVVRLTGASSRIDAISTEDINCYVDLSNMTTGTNYVTVLVDCDDPLLTARVIENSMISVVVE